MHEASHFPFLIFPEEKEENPFPLFLKHFPFPKRYREMVRIHVKHSCRQHVNGAAGELEFLYDREASSTIQHITQDITEIANFQLQIQQLGSQLLPPVSALLQTHSPQVIALHRALSEATSYASKEQVVHGKPLSSLVLRDHIRIIETEFMVNYKLLNFQDCNFRQLLSDLKLLQEDTVQLLWAGKELMKGKNLCDYIGKNEKTKIMLRLQSQVLNPAC